MRGGRVPEQLDGDGRAAAEALLPSRLLPRLPPRHHQGPVAVGAWAGSAEDCRHLSV